MADGSSHREPGGPRGPVPGSCASHGEGESAHCGLSAEMWGDWEGPLPSRGPRPPGPSLLWGRRLSEEGPCREGMRPAAHPEGGGRHRQSIPPLHGEWDEAAAVLVLRGLGSN